MPPPGLDQAEQGARVVIVVGGHSLHRWLPIDEGDGVSARAPIDVTFSHPMIGT